MHSIEPTNPATTAAAGRGAAQRVHLGTGGADIALTRSGAVHVRSEVPFIVGESRYCAGFPHRIQARAGLRLWPMGDRAGAVLVYR